jgi:Na+-driven multidrug efflux pump
VAVGVITVLFPEQIVGLLTDKTDTVGVVFTVIAVVAEFALKQPAALVPVNVYV